MRMNLRRVLFLIFSLFIFCLILGCKTAEIDNDNTEKGVATSNQKSKYIIKFENVKVDDHFDHNRLWAEDFEGNVIKEDIEADIPRPIKNIYQRDFDGDGHDDLLIATEPYENGLFFDFGVFTLDKDFNATEVFYGDGSISHCDYWFLTDDNKLIHMNSIRNYENEDNAVYKSRYTCVAYTPKKEKGELVFESGKVIKTKYELDNLKEIRDALGIPENAIVISNITVE